MHLNRPVPQLVTGRQLTAALESPITASWEHVPLRELLRRVSATEKVALLLDRRIDPTQELSLDLHNETVANGLRRIAERIAARLSVTRNVVYLGPDEAAGKLPTLLSLRRQELAALLPDASRSRRRVLARRQTVHWNDLDRPADLLRRIADHYNLSIPNLQQIPHDLWAGASLPDVDVVTALSLILIQFDRTFQWNDQLDGIRLVPIPQNMAARRTDRPETGDATTSPPPTPLNRRLFSLRIQQAPAGALLEKLASSGIEIRYDEKALARAGIDLQTRLTFTVREADAEEFFRTLCEPLGLRFHIEGNTVTLTPENE